MKIKGILEALDLDPAVLENLRRMRAEAAAQWLMFSTVIVARGGNIHGVNHAATAKRRAKRKANRRRS